MAGAGLERARRPLTPAPARGSQDQETRHYPLPGLERLLLDPEAVAGVPALRACGEWALPGSCLPWGPCGCLLLGARGRSLHAERLLGAQALLQCNLNAGTPVPLLSPL